MIFQTLGGEDFSVFLLFCGKMDYFIFKLTEV